MKRWLLITLLFHSLAFAQGLQFLNPLSLDLRTFPPPPAEGSPEDKADQGAVLAWQILRSPYQCERAAYEANGYASTFFSVPYGPLSPAAMERVSPFIERIYLDIKYFVRMVKVIYIRKRPAERDPSIIPCIEPHPSTSYPSGHGVTAYVVARVLALIYPESAHLLFQRAREVALDREIGGVHFSSDSRAAELLGEKIFTALLNSPGFNDEIKKLRAR